MCVCGKCIVPRVVKSRQKEAAGATDAGPMQIEWSGGERSRLAGAGGGSADEENGRAGVQIGDCGEWREASRSGGRGGEAQGYRAWGNTQRFRVGKEGFS